MSAREIMLTHAQVVIDPEVAMPDWGLSDLGAARHKRFAEALDCARVKTVFCSDERKARDGAAIAGHALPGDGGCWIAFETDPGTAPTDWNLI